MPVSWLLVSDIDGTLTGDAAALDDLMRRLAAERSRIAFGVASGRSPELIREAVQRFGLNEPSLVIASVGTEIYDVDGPVHAYGDRIRPGWDRSAVVSALEGLPGLQPQGPAGQRPFKVSFNAADSVLPDVRAALHAAGLRVKLVHSHGAYLDVLPAGASKGAAVRFAAASLGVPLERVVVAGDSGNDADMLTAGANAVVVANYDRELAPYLDQSNVYVARGRHAAGVLEGLRHFGAL